MSLCPSESPEGAIMMVIKEVCVVEPVVSLSVDWSCWCTADVDDCGSVDDSDEVSVIWLVSDTANDDSSVGTWMAGEPPGLG